MLQEFGGNRPNIDPNKFEVQQVFALLQQKQLLKVQGNRVIIDPPIFQAYVKSVSGSDT